MTTKTNTVAPMEKARERLLLKMPEALKAVAKRFDKTAASLALGTLNMRHNDGQVLVKVLEDTAKYGSSAAEQLAAYRGCSTGDIYLLRNFALTYTKEEVKEKFEGTMAGGRVWTLKHVQQLIAIDSEKQREQLYRRCKDKGLSANELSAVVSATAEKTHKRAGGRPPARPTSIPAGMQQIDKKTTELFNRVNIWKTDVADAIMNIPPDNVTPELVISYNTSLANVENLIADLQDLKKKMDPGAKRLQRVSSKDTDAAVPTAKKRFLKKKASKKKVLKKGVSKKKGSKKKPAN